MKKKIVSFSMYDETLKKLRQLAEREHRTMSGFIWWLIDREYYDVFSLDVYEENPRSISDEIS